MRVVVRLNATRCPPKSGIRWLEPPKQGFTGVSCCYRDRDEHKTTLSSVTRNEAEREDFGELTRGNRWALPDVDVHRVSKQEICESPHVAHHNPDYEVQEPYPVVHRPNRRQEVLLDRLVPNWTGTIWKILFCL